MILGSACAPVPKPATSQPVKVFASSAAYPWLDEAYRCTSPSMVIDLAPPDDAQVRLAFGEPEQLASPAFQVGTDDLLVVVQPQTAVGNLSLDQVRQVFSGEVARWTDVGGADLPIQVWTYAQDEDIQQLFSHLIMQGQPVASFARLAVSAQAMSDSVGSNPGSVGFLPRRWKTGNTNPVLTIPSVPILAVTASPPQGPLRDLIACMQSKD